MTTALNSAVTYAATEILGKNCPKKKPWITPEILELQIWFWTDGTPDFYNGNLIYSDFSLYTDLCAYLSIYPPLYMYMVPCSKPWLTAFICEQRLSYNNSVPKQNVHLPNVSFSEIDFRMKDMFIDCGGNHFTFQFLSCEPRSHCQTNTFLSNCNLNSSQENSSRTSVSFNLLLLVEMFECEKYEETVHYTMVCDFRRDCTDGSDETRCKHRENGSGFRCSYGQWIADSKVCDMRDDCLDGSDELLCDNFRMKKTDFHNRPHAPVIIHMDGRGSYTLEAMDPADLTCPDTHFRCPGTDVYCMPVYLRCNGVKDCLGGEDEVNCDDITCPGYYRCMSSSVCLHGNHLCDGWPQCPQRDDELLCNATCPSACHCQGLAFVCHQPFPASHYPDLRYLDATGSGMIPEDVAENFYLVHLCLSACGLTKWPEITLVNLQILDLSNNQLSVFLLQYVHLLQNLIVLRLRENPVTSIYGGYFNRSHTSLTTLDLSQTAISYFDSVSISMFTSIQKLNMSFSSLNKISDTGFTNLPELSVIDLRGCDIKEFPYNVFGGLSQMRYIYAQNYKLCCKVTLPEDFNPDSCVAPRDEISSCEDLMRSNFYRVCLWLFAVMSAVGNIGSIMFKIIFQRDNLLKSGYNVFVTTLCMSDILMGVYLVIVGAADELYRGNYLWYETRWKTSVACQVAGFLSLLSNEVSTFMISLITLDRFIVLRFPFSTVRFNGLSAVSASTLACVLGVGLAVVPLLPGLSHWNFYSQTGICIPLPVTRIDFPGKNYSFGIMIIFNFVIFLVIAVGQWFIYWSIRSNSLTLSDSASKSHNATIARRLITVVVSNFCCWFPIGVLGLAAISGTPVPGEVNVAIVIFVLPLNSALNPFLYTYNLLMEKRRLKIESKMIAKMIERLRHDTKSRHTDHSSCKNLH